MSSLRGLKPTAGLIIFLGAGYASVSLGYCDSDARQRLASRAAETRKQVILAALSKRLQQQSQQPQRDAPGDLTVAKEQLVATHRAAAIASPPSTPANPDILLKDGIFYVVIGPDVHLTAIARDRIRRTLQLRASTNMSAASSVHQTSPAHLAVPHDCVIGSGLLSSLVEKQLLSRQAPPQIHDESEQLQRPTALRTSSEAVEAEDLWDDAILSSWDRLVLTTTRSIMNPKQLDHVALWALERALMPASPGARRLSPTPANEETLSTSAYSSPPSPWATVGTEGPTVDAEGNTVAATGGKEREAKVPVMPEERSNSQAVETEAVCGGANSFVLEIVSSASRDQASFEGRSKEDRKRMESPALGGEVVRWAWSLANRGLGDVIVSSSNLWILAELRQALEELVSGSAKGAGDSDGVRKIKGFTVDDGLPSATSEVILVRVALPSAVEREQAVTAVAEELGVDHRLSARDVSTLADLTGGRRGALLDVLKRLQTSPPSAKVAEICRAAVDDQALALARCWGLLSQDNTSPVEESENGYIQVKDNNEFGPEGKEQLRQEEDDRVALWEALHVLSAPVVSVGAAASASAPMPPQGNMPPSELLRACELDPAALLRLTREGWLEVSPAGSPSGSGVALLDPETIPDSSTASLSQDCGEPLTVNRPSQVRSPPTVRVFVESVPVESLGCLLHRSFVGAAPLQLAAFRRLADSATPPSKNQGIGDSLSMLAGGGEGEGDGQDGSDRYADAWQAGQLERAGCLIEASVLRRQIEREDERLADDCETLSSCWSELGSVREDLERQGRGDASDGEWAEVQLELIRQERAVVAEAQEMRTRRLRVEKIRDDIQGLERRGRSVSPSLSGPFLRREISSEASALPVTDSIIGLEPSSRVGGKQRRVSLAEEGVLRDAEGEIRLMPLRELSQESGVSVEEGRDMDRGQPVGEGDRGVLAWGYGRRFWKWMRGG